MLRKILFSLFILAVITVSVIAVTASQAPGTTDDSLKLKADSALTFCKAKGFDTSFCILVDMKAHSGKKRLFVWDFNKNEVTNSSLCCHGMGKESTGEKPVFSNEEGSYCTSLGKYKIGIRSYSKWGINIHYKLHGLESTNSNAFKRIVVLHSFDPVPDKEICPFHLPMGWSLGCPVISNTTMRTLDDLLKKADKPVLLWIYY